MKSPSVPKAAININASGTPPELANTAEMLSKTDVSLGPALFTITYAKSPPNSAPINAVMLASFMLTTNA